MRTSATLAALITAFLTLENTVLGVVLLLFVCVGGVFLWLNHRINSLGDVTDEQARRLSLLERQSPLLDD